jgi:hypothetical protein
MAKGNKVLLNSLSKQGSLFDMEITEGALDVSMAFRDVLSRVLRECKDSRWQVAGKISELTGHNLSKNVLDKCTSGDLSYGLRAEDLPAFCAVTDSIEPFKVLLEVLGCEIVVPEEARLVKLARLERKKAVLEAEIKRLKRDVGLE